MMCPYAYQTCNRGAKACELLPPKLGEDPEVILIAADACPYAGHPLPRSVYSHARRRVKVEIVPADFAIEGEQARSG